jgi:myo-inositol catabolism protein IolC
MKFKLYILPFDHRHSFEKIVGGKNVKKIREYKQIIYSAFKKAITCGLNKKNVGILVDETYGEKILLNAKKKEIITCYTLEKSGQKEFQFDRKDWKKRIKLFKPNYVKVLLRYNPNGDEKLNKRQIEKLAKLSKYLKNQETEFLLEVLVPATDKQLNKATSKQKYDLNMRPRLTLKAIKELQKGGVDPTIWKIEGLDKLKDMKLISRQIKNFNSDASIIVLGRGENKKHAEKWLTIGAKVPGVIGFAVGRTVFNQPLLDYQNKKINKQEVINKIMKNYLHFVKLFDKVKRG